MPLADGAFAFPLVLGSALNISSRSCSFFHLWAHLTAKKQQKNKLVNIDEGHTASLFKSGVGGEGDRRQNNAGNNNKKIEGPTCGFNFPDKSLSASAACFFSGLSRNVWRRWLYLEVFKWWSIFFFFLPQRSRGMPAPRRHRHLVSPPRQAITCTLEANHLVMWSNGEKHTQTPS